MTYTNLDIAAILNASIEGCRQPLTITQLLTDSRSLSLADETIFFALRSERGNGHLYIDELAMRGVRCFVVDTLPKEMPADCSFILVKDTLAALQLLAREHRKQFSVPVVGITGSNGKTIVKEWLSAILRPSLRVTRSPRSYNSQIGVPLSVWQMDAQTEVGIFEAGISKAGEMKRLEDIIEPEIGVFTHLGVAHQENFMSAGMSPAQVEIAIEKMQLMRRCKTVVYPADVAVLTKQLDIQAHNAAIVGWTRRSTPAAIQLLSIEPAGEDSVTLHYSITPAATLPQLSQHIGTHSCILPFSDEASIENAMSVLCTALVLGITPIQIAERMPLLESVAMRLEVKAGRRGLLLINDGYNSDISSLRVALDFLVRRSERHGLPSTIILSDMIDTGESPDILYSKISRLVQSHKINRILTIGHDIQCLQLPNAMHFATVEDFLSSRIMQEMHDEVVLLKGARRFRFERIDEALTLHTHETQLRVNLTALIDNLNYYRSLLRPTTKVVCMVKASAYGAGAVEVAKTLQEHGVEYLAVAVADEGVALRRAGITTGIIVMNPERNALTPLFEYHLEPEVYSFGMLSTLIDTARRYGTALPIHIKIDTGMHRLGFAPTEMTQLSEALQGQDMLIVRSVFSHLAGSDSEALDDFTRQQIATFKHAADNLSVSHTQPLRHILNTAGIERFADAQMDMVRLGLGLYGISPCGENNHLRAVGTLETVILQIQDIPAGETVGYSRRTVLQRPSRIANIPIGYADGLDRHLGNGKGYCIVNGKQAPYAGNICMDIAMIDVTDIPCDENDRVEIFGEVLTVQAIADRLDTIPYEILTSVSDRVKRVYFQES